jgi:prolyl 4-hydroxylase
MIIEANFLSESELISFIHLIRQHATPTPKEGWSVDECNSAAVYLEKIDSPLAEGIARRLVARIGVNPTCSEGLRGVWYRAGEGYKVHHDAFQISARGDDPFFRPAGNRAVSAMVYLNTVTVGGATIFPNLGVSIAPRAGTLAYWKNLDDAGTPDSRMIHLAAPPAGTDKYILNAWYRERPLP